MLRRLYAIALGVLVAMVFASPLAYGQGTTTYQQTTIETKVPVKKVAKKAKPIETTTTTLTVVKEPEPRAVLSQDTLKKIQNTMCADGFKAYIGNDKKNVCGGKATAPDIAYTCVWKSKGPMAFAPTHKGPCNLDFAEHQGDMSVTREKFSSSPPLKYGTDAQCCYRAAKGTP